MGVPVLVLGESGAGKSYSLRNFSPDEIGIINVLNKPLPFPGNYKTFHTRNIQSVRAAISQAKTNVVVVDDFGYLITDLYMRYSHGEEKLRDQYEVYKIIGSEVYSLITDIQEKLDDNKIVYLTMHTDTSNGTIEPLTIGRLLNEKIKLVGMFTITILARIYGEERQFVTNGIPPTKCPPGMLPEIMDNDLKAVDTAIREFWNLAPLAKVKE